MDKKPKHFRIVAGKGRWSPSPTLRKLGYKSFYFADKDGTPYPIDEAIARCMLYNVEVDKKVGRKGNVVGERRSKEREDDPHKVGWVYFLWAGRNVKIGFSTSPHRRLAELSTMGGSTIKRVVVVRGSMADEKRLHRRFAVCRQHGEWFFANDPMKEFLDEVAVKGLLPFK